MARPLEEAEVTKTNDALVEASKKALMFLHVLSEDVYQHGSFFHQDYERIIDNLTKALAKFNKRTR